jgi:hypothetical protein
VDKLTAVLSRHAPLLTQLTIKGEHSLEFEVLALDHAWRIAVCEFSVLLMLSKEMVVKEISIIVD